MPRILSLELGMAAALLLALPAAWAAETNSPAGPPTNPPAPVRRTAPPIAQPPVDFNHPPRAYLTNRVQEWTVLVEKELADRDPGLERLALARLDLMLTKAFGALPTAARPVLQRLPLFLMYGEKATGGGLDNGLEYFQPTAPAHRKELDPRMASSLLIYSATNWVWLPEHRALMALTHELAHAWHLEQWPESREDIYDAWDHARAQGLYREVPDEDHRTLKQGYALQNHLEYFAELSMIYFVGGYYHPFTRERLKTYDPQGYALVRQLWGLKD